MWVAIEGYKYPYRINEEARVQKYDKGKWIDLSTKLRKGNQAVSVWMRGVNGEEMYVSLTRLMAEAFMGGRRPGYNIIHKNGVKQDCYLDNLEFIKNEDSGKKFGGLARRMPVLKVDRNGEILAAYKNAKEAAKENFMFEDNVKRHCRGAIKNPFKFNDFTFVYDK